MRFIKYMLILGTAVFCAFASAQSLDRQIDIAFREANEAAYLEDWPRAVEIFAKASELIGPSHKDYWQVKSNEAMFSAAGGEMARSTRILDECISRGFPELLIKACSTIKQGLLPRTPENIRRSMQMNAESYLNKHYPDRLAELRSQKTQRAATPSENRSQAYSGGSPEATGKTAFYAYVYGGSHTSYVAGQKVVRSNYRITFALHPASLEAAKSIACAAMENDSSGRGRDCKEGRKPSNLSIVSCENGGYFALAEAGGYLDGAAGAVGCGFATKKQAIDQALQLCERERAKEGVPQPCKLTVAALNDGRYGGSRDPYDPFSGQKFQVNHCWGSDRTHDASEQHQWEKYCRESASR